jgi:AbrB family looped-hinge helix DNA binding protein
LERNIILVRDGDKVIGFKTSFDRTKAEGFNDILVEAILESTDCGEVILRIIEFFAINRSRLAEKPEILSIWLENLLEESAGTVKKKIVRNLYAKLGIENVEAESRDFPRIIRGAHNEYMKMAYRIRDELRVKIDYRGRIYVPKKVRRKLKIKEGSTLSVKEEEGDLRILTS